MTAVDAGVTVRAARPDDCAFVLGLAPSVVDFGLPAGRDPEPVAEAFARELRQALERGHDRIGLAAFTTNQRAVRFYEGLGYQGQLLAMTKPLTDGAR